jgi:hypothetical protein
MRDTVGGKRAPFRAGLMALRKPQAEAYGAVPGWKEIGCCN